MISHKLYNSCYLQNCVLYLCMININLTYPMVRQSRVKIRVTPETHTIIAISGTKSSSAVAVHTLYYVSIVLCVVNQLTWCVDSDGSIPASFLLSILYPHYTNIHSTMNVFSWWDWKSVEEGITLKNVGILFYRVPWWVYIPATCICIISP